MAANHPTNYHALQESDAQIIAIDVDNPNSTIHAKGFHHRDPSDHHGRSNRDSTLTLAATGDSYYKGHKAKSSVSSTQGTSNGISREVLGYAGPIYRVSRTPSPTPSEQRELERGVIDWKGMASWKFWFRRKWLWYYVGALVIGVFTAVFSFFHKRIIDWLTPAAEYLRDTKGGWAVPIAILFVLSFPPLFGHEIVAILCGLVFGLLKGFAIVAAGTLLGEIGNFYTFKYCCRGRAAKLERENIGYACLAKVVRDGGFKIAVIVRLSIVPGHFTTAIFSTCGMGIVSFIIAAVLSMPKQLIGVYLGTMLQEPGSNGGSTSSESEKTIVNALVLGATVLITIAAMWYIVRQMNEVKPGIIYERRKARQAKLERGSTVGHHRSGSENTLVAGDPSDTFDPYAKTVRANESYPAPHVEAPQPLRPGPGHLPEILQPPVRGRSQHAVRMDSAEEVGWDLGARAEQPIQSAN